MIMTINPLNSIFDFFVKNLPKREEVFVVCMIFFSSSTFEKYQVFIRFGVYPALILDPVFGAVDPFVAIQRLHG